MAVVLGILGCLAPSRPQPEPGNTRGPHAAPDHTRPPAPAKQPPPEPPLVNIDAFRSMGKLAFVWNRALWVLDGERGHLRQVSRGPAVAPAWSHDGRWLAYVRQDPAGARPGVVAYTDAAGEVEMSLDLPAHRFAWSPARPLLAIAAAADGGPGGLRVLQPGHPPAQIAAAGTQVFDLAWAPDGRSLAYVITLPYPPERPETRSDTLFTVPVAGGEPVRQHAADQAGIRLNGWWPDGGGILFWTVPLHSASIAADGLPLESLRWGSTPRALAQTLTYREWLSWSPDGRQLALVRGGGREAWRNKELAVCDVRAATCRGLAQPPGTVSLDPAWSPRGDWIAFVRAAEPRVAPSGTGRIAQWVQTRTLWLTSPDGTRMQPLSRAGAGVYAPAWSADGRHLLYVRENALWLLEVAGDSDPVRVVGPFPGEPHLFGYYGHLSWSHLFDWYRPPRPRG